jgi:hypothetical protein
MEDPASPIPPELGRDPDAGPFQDLTELAAGPCREAGVSGPVAAEGAGGVAVGHDDLWRRAVPPGHHRARRQP